MTDETLQLVREALDEAARFFDNRDEMNAAVHCGEVRWSPLTLLIRQARVAVLERSDWVDPETLCDADD